MKALGVLAGLAILLLVQLWLWCQARRQRLRHPLQSRPSGLGDRVSEASSTPDTSPTSIDF